MKQTLIEELSAKAESRKYRPGKTIIRQGAPAKEFFILTSGTVDVIRTVEFGERQSVSSMTAPAFFGEVGLLEEGRRTATVRASTESPVEVLVISKEKFEEFVDASEMMADEIAVLMQSYRLNDSLSEALGAMPSDSLAEVASQAQVLTFEQGEQIICQGDSADFFYILTKGRAEVLHRCEDGRTFLINFHDPGEYFGEIGLLQNRPRSVTVRAVDKIVEVLAFEKSVFQDMHRDSEETESAIGQEMIRRLARQMKTGGDLS